MSSIHIEIGRRAYDALPARDRALIRPDMRPAALAKAYLPKGLRTVGDKVAALCNLMDCVYFEECRPYATFPDGRWIPHGPADAQGQGAVGSRQPISRVASTAITVKLMSRMVAAIRKGDWEEAVMRGGVLAHYLQDSLTPGHCLDNTIFHEFFPDPDPRRHARLHHLFDRADPNFRCPPPRLMGTTVSEAAFRLQVEVDRGMAAAKRVVGRIIRSYHRGEPAKVRQAMLRDSARQAAFATASAWHTAIAIATRRFARSEVAALRGLSLCELTPYFLHDWQYVSLLPGHLVKNERKIPIHVWAQSARGRRWEQLVRDGFGMGGHMGMKFFVDGDVYPKFRCRVGLPSRHTEGQDEHTDTTFFIETDREENRVYSEEIVYRGKRVFACRLRPGQPVRDVEVNIKGARTLILGARCEPWTDPKTRQPRFSIPHVAVCEPRLLRNFTGEPAANGANRNSSGI